MSEVVIVYIPKTLHEKVLKKIEGTSHKSVQEYVIAKLEEVFPDEVEYTEEEAAIIRDRLKALGYLE